jgi:hypothetical protein
MDLRGKERAVLCIINAYPELLEDVARNGSPVSLSGNDVMCLRSRWPREAPALTFLRWGTLRGS